MRFGPLYSEVHTWPKKNHLNVYMPFRGGDYEMMIRQLQTCEAKITENMKEMTGYVCKFLHVQNVLFPKDKTKKE